MTSPLGLQHFSCLSLFWALLFRGLLYLLTLEILLLLPFKVFFSHLSSLSSHSENVSRWLWELMTLFSMLLSFLSYFFSLFQGLPRSVFQLKSLFPSCSHFAVIHLLKKKNGSDQKQFSRPLSDSAEEIPASMSWRRLIKLSAESSSLFFN